MILDNEAQRRVLLLALDQSAERAQHRPWHEAAADVLVLARTRADVVAAVIPTPDDPAPGSAKSAGRG